MSFPRLRALLQWLGPETNRTSHAEKWLSALGALFGVYAVLLINRDYLLLNGAMLIVASMGATAVLLFAVPHGSLSQPWSVAGGQLLSAAIGVTCQQWLPDQSITPALATGLAIGAMHYARCLHPPGGATALAAVIGGPEVHALGYGYLLTPVLSNVVVILAMAVAFNAWFPWRRYPNAWSSRGMLQPGASAAHRRGGITHEDLTAALRIRNSFVDVSPAELAEIFELALAHAETTEHATQLALGACYSNGLIGRRWSVRRIIDEGGRPRRSMIVYKVVAGADLYQTGVCSRDEFSRWARFPVREEDGHWVRCRLGETVGAGAVAR